MDLTVPEPDQADALFRAHGPVVRAYLGARLRDPAAAEDLAQEVFVAAIARGVPPDGAARWLLGIARNKALKHHRDRQRSAPLEHDPTSARPGPAQRVGRSEERAQVRSAVADLEPELREAIRLRYEDGLSYPAIAERLGLPQSTVQGRLKRARLALRSALRDLVIEEGGR